MAIRWAQLCEAETGRVLVPRLEVGDSALKRALGLMGRAHLAEDSGLWLEPCNGIHTFFMRFPIDVLILDAQGLALRTLPAVRPWRFCLPVRGGRTVVELPAGTLAAQGIRQGGRYIQTQI
jgi:uncharacterized membrane protein (UPF0127 family)